MKNIEEKYAIGSFHTYDKPLPHAATVRVTGVPVKDAMVYMDNGYYMCMKGYTEKYGDPLTNNNVKKIVRFWAIPCCFVDLFYGEKTFIIVQE